MEKRSSLLSKNQKFANEKIGCRSGPCKRDIGEVRIEGKGANHDIEREECREKREPRGEKKEPDFGSFFEATRLEDKADIQEVSDCVGQKEGRRIVLSRASEAEVVS